MPESLRSAAEGAMREHGFEPAFSPAVIREVRALDEPAERGRLYDERLVR